MAVACPDGPNFGKPIVAELVSGYKRVKHGVSEGYCSGLVDFYHSAPLVTQAWAIIHKEELKPLFGCDVRSTQVCKEQARDKVAGYLNPELLADTFQHVRPGSPTIPPETDSCGL